MEKAELDLTTALQQDSLSLKTRLKIAVDVANGLKAMHSANYVHQDLKADAILVSYNAHVISFPLGLTPKMNTEYSISCQVQEIT